MGRAAHVTELDVAHRLVGVDVERHGQRQQVLVVVPVDVHDDVEAGRAGGQAVGGRERRRPDGARDPDRTEQRPRSSTSMASHSVERPAQPARPALQVPRVVLDGVVGSQLQGDGPARPEQLPVVVQRADGDERARVVPGHGQMAVGE